MALIITRPETDAQRFARLVKRRLGEACPELIISPVMMIRYTLPRKPLTGYGGLAFTSANGVRALSASGFPPDPDLPVFAVGSMTAEEARLAGYSQIMTAAGHVDALAKVIVEYYHDRAIPSAILHIAGSHRRGDLLELLKEYDLPCERIVLYTADAISSLVAGAQQQLTFGGEVDVALFSPRSVKVFEAQCAQYAGPGHTPLTLNARALCLSEAVAQSCSQSNWREIAIAAEPTAEALCDLLAP